MWRILSGLLMCCFLINASFGYVPTVLGEENSVGGTGSFYIHQSINGEWQEKFIEPFTTEYQTKNFSLTPDNGMIKLQLNQKNVSYGDIEFAHLYACGQKIEPLYSRYTTTGENVFGDLLYDDHNVVVAHEKPIEILWKLPGGCSDQVVLALKANEYESPEKNAFRFPDWETSHHTYVFKNNGTMKVDGFIDEVDGVVNPDFSPYWKSGTGHPSNFTHLYFRDDADFVYVSADIPLDNTSEYGQDWIKIFVKNSVFGQEKEYRVDDYLSEYGKCIFGLTSMVSHKHQACEVKIPKAEIRGNKLDFVLRYYGTSSSDPSVAIDQLTIANSSDTTPTLTGRARGIDGAGAITAVTFGIHNNTTDEVVVANYSGTCTADDGDFDETTEMFSCTPSNALLYNHYVFNIRGVAGGDSGTGTSEFFVLDNAFSTQSNTDGFGDNQNFGTLAFATYSSKLFAGTYNQSTGAEVWEYNGTSWTQSNTDGFGDINNESVKALATYNSKLYAGTSNSVTGAEVWEYNGTSWTQSNTDGFGDDGNTSVNALASYNGKLYAGTSHNSAGTEVWEFNGTSWVQSNTSGFGDTDNMRILSLHVHNSTLYAGTYNSVDGAELWKYSGSSWTLEDNAGLGNSNNTGIYSMATFNSALYVGTSKSSGSQVLTGSSGSWTQANSNGFSTGQSDSQEVSSLAVYNGRLYAGVRSDSGNDYGGEIWSTSNGSTWKLHTKGYGDTETTDVRAIHVFRGILFADGYNISTGAEVWTSNTDTAAPSLSLTAVTDPTSDTTPSLSGTASDSLGALITDVEFQMNGTGGTWIDCTADDGTFDEADEAFTCAVTSALDSGSHTMYVRATDSNSNTTSSGSYSSDAFTIPTSPTATPAPTGIPTSSAEPELPQIPHGQSEEVGGAFTPIKDSYTDNQPASVIVEPGTFTNDAYFSAQITTPAFENGILQSPLSVTLPLSAGALRTNTVMAGGDGLTGGILAIRQACGLMWQVGGIQQMWFKTYPPKGSDKPAAIIIPELQSHPSIIALGYSLSDLIPPGSPNKPFKASGLKLAHSLDGSTWSILSTSVVDTSNRTVAALHKVGGFYMIVAGCQNQEFVQPVRENLTLGVSDDIPNSDIKAMQPIGEKANTLPKKASLLQRVSEFVMSIFKY